MGIPRATKAALAAAIALLCLTGASGYTVSAPPTDPEMAYGVPPWRRFDVARSKLAAREKESREFCIRVTAVNGEEVDSSSGAPNDGACTAEALVETSGAVSTAGSDGYWKLTSVRLLLDAPSPGAAAEGHRATVVADAEWTGYGVAVEQTCPYELVTETGEVVSWGYAPIGPLETKVDDLTVVSHTTRVDLLPGVPVRAEVDCTRRF